MFEVYCPAHRSSVLLTIRRIERIHSSPRGVVVDWRCWCGHAGRRVGGRASHSAELPEAS